MHVCMEMSVVQRCMEMNVCEGVCGEECVCKGV